MLQGNKTFSTFLENFFLQELGGRGENEQR